MPHFAWELSANVFNAAAIVLAGRNSVHTWWTGIIGCALFGWVFYAAQLYADATLQVFFVATSVFGWWHWLHGDQGHEQPVRRSSFRWIALSLAIGVLVTIGYAMLLRRFTDAFAPLPDSAVLAFSVLGQVLLMARRVESWWCWILVNTIAVPLYFARGLHLTAVLYIGFWINALIAARHWRRLARDAAPPAAPPSDAAAMSSRSAQLK